MPRLLSATLQTFTTNVGISRENVMNALSLLADW
jgi:hypothetical protein